jgi:hypothetical protein
MKPDQDLELRIRGEATPEYRARLESSAKALARVIARKVLRDRGLLR